MISEPFEHHRALPILSRFQLPYLMAMAGRQELSGLFPYTVTLRSAYDVTFLFNNASRAWAGASVDSYLPEDMTPSKMIGIGMNADEMAANSRLTERVLQNLNKKVRYIP